MMIMPRFSLSDERTIRLRNEKTGYFMNPVSLEIISLIIGRSCSKDD